MKQATKMAAYGGDGFQRRNKGIKQEIGEIWGHCGLNCEWTRLKAVLLHRPGRELDIAGVADKMLMDEVPDWETARKQHDLMAQAYRDAGVKVTLIEPKESPPPNQLFMADLFFMTPEGAILGRPAGQIRAGEERHVAHSLAHLEIPILKSKSSPLK